MDNTLQRIKKFIDSKGISVRRFEESMGFSNGSFASQLKNNRTIGVDKIEYILQKYPEINPTWLLTGSGQMLIEENSNNNPSSVQEPPSPYGNQTTTKLFEYLSSLVNSSNTLAKSNEKLVESNQQLVENNRQLVENNNEMSRKMMEWIQNQENVRPGTADAV